MPDKMETLRAAIAAAEGAEFITLRIADVQWLLDGAPDEPEVPADADI